MSKQAKIMKKITITTVVLVCMVVLGFGAVVANCETYGGGTGEPNDPYLIYDACDMQAIGADANYWDAHFKLMVDVDLSAYTGTSFNIIGYYVSSVDNKPFTGSFDGNGCRITGLTLGDGSAGNDCLGLFGYIDDGEVRNLGIEGCSVSGDDYVGGLVAINHGRVSNCYSSGSVSGCTYVGGMVGLNRSYGSLSNCYSTSDVSGDWGVGGLVGLNRSYGSLSNCHSTGDVDSGDEYVGGLVGQNGGSLSNCYSTGDVGGDVYVGGLVARNYGSVSNCHSTGDVDGDNYVGGLVGQNGGSVSSYHSTGDVDGGDYYVGGLLGANDGSVSNCYSTGNVSGDYYVGGQVGINGGSVSNCYSSGSVSGCVDVGGLVGINRRYASALLLL